jgi:hypothetical protein
MKRQQTELVPCLAYTLTLNMEAVYSSETWVDLYQIIQRYKPEDHTSSYSLLWEPQIQQICVCPTASFTSVHGRETKCYYIILWQHFYWSSSFTGTWSTVAIFRDTKYINIYIHLTSGIYYIGLFSYNLRSLLVKITLWFTEQNKIVLFALQRNNIMHIGKCGKGAVALMSISIPVTASRSWRVVTSTWWESLLLPMIPTAMPAGA